MMTRTINLLDDPVCLEMPRWLVESAWIEHIPFALWVTSVLRPRVFVELGAYRGASYCAFCQAIATLGLDTQAFAVDTWAGDVHMGAYGKQVYLDLKAHHDPHYAHFSSLLRTDFDEASNRFQEKQIDLLHIDGTHTYEAVSHDFETWLPKMSPRGVIVFHDVTEHLPGFGVWKLWDELAVRYPSFTFGHEHGLGVMAVGTELPSTLQTLLVARGTQADNIRTLFEQLGKRLRIGFELEAYKPQLKEVPRLQAIAEDYQNMKNHCGHLEHELPRLQALEVEHRRLLNTTTELVRELEQVKCERSELEASASWRLTQNLSTLGNKLAPVGTRRRTLLVPNSPRTFATRD